MFSRFVLRPLYASSIPILLFFCVFGFIGFLQFNIVPLTSNQHAWAERTTNVVGPWKKIRVSEDEEEEGEEEEEKKDEVEEKDEEGEGEKEGTEKEKQKEKDGEE